MDYQCNRRTFGRPQDGRTMVEAWSVYVREGKFATAQGGSLDRIHDSTANFLLVIFFRLSYLLLGFSLLTFDFSYYFSRNHPRHRLADQMVRNARRAQEKIRATMKTTGKTATDLPKREAGIWPFQQRFMNFPNCIRSAPFPQKMIGNRMRLVLSRGAWDTWTSRSRWRKNHKNAWALSRGSGNGPRKRSTNSLDTAKSRGRDTSKNMIPSAKPCITWTKFGAWAVLRYVTKPASPFFLSFGCFPIDSCPTLFYIPSNGIS